MSKLVATITQQQAIVLRDVSFAYGNSAPIIRSCSLSVARGKAFALLGPNGSGKTTLLKLIARALTPSSGTIENNGQLAYVPQFLQLSFAYSVLDVVLMGRARQIGMFATPSKRDTDSAMSALERVGMLAFATRSFEELSGGERQLVAFARALVSDAQILVLDEPASALDLRHQELVLQWINKLVYTDGLTVVFSTHHPQHADAIADEVALIFEPGRVEIGATAELLTAERVGALFGVSMRRYVDGQATAAGRGTLVTEWRI